MSDEYLARKMSRTEAKLLTPEETRERKKAQSRINNKQYRENNPEYTKTQKKFRENNPEYQKKYNQSPTGKKSNTLSQWVTVRGLQESKEDLEWIYDLFLHQELCYSCDVKLTRDGVNCPTQACLDHSHITHRFRQICCRACNSNDHWMTYWC